MRRTMRAKTTGFCVGVLTVAILTLYQPVAYGADEGQTPPGDESATSQRSTNLPLPRYVSLRTDPINMRTGPGVRYPVDWVYTRRGFPVEITAEFDTWRRVRDLDGSDGWIHTSMLSSRRTAVVDGGLRPLRRTSANDGEILAHAESGVVVTILRCPEGSFCRVEVDGVQGWMRRDHIWGVYPNEEIE